jgi:hypothetical protein
LFVVVFIRPFCCVFAQKTDPAKMNRAAHLYRPAPTAEDLSATAEGMVRSANLKGYLQALARAYFKVYHMQSEWNHEDFWGLREFYSLIKVRDLIFLSRLSNHSATIYTKFVFRFTVTTSG